MAGPRVFAWTPRGRAPWGTDPGVRDPRLIAEVVERFGQFIGHESWFGLEVAGWDNVPAAPAMLVSNHSGGTTIPDVWGLMVAWVRHFGTERAVHPMAHDMVFAFDGLGRFFARLGVLRARPEMAEVVLRDWRRDVFVCPGGDRDTWRPYRDRWRVNFAGRKGYARLALRTGTPIVPVAHAGAHETLVVLSDGQRLARRIRLPELFRAAIFPVHVSLPWGLGVGPLPHIPVPVDLRYRIGGIVPPPEDHRPGEEPTPEMVDTYDRRVQAAIQALLDELRDAAPGARAQAKRAMRVARRIVRSRRSRRPR